VRPMRVATCILIGVVGCGGAQARGEAKDPSDSTEAAQDDTPRWEGAQPRQEQRKPTGAVVNEGGTRRSDEYDKEATEVVLKRAARQVKENCGAARDESGKATGPWGKATLQIALGHNGRSKGVTVPPPYAGQPTGNCVEKAFTNLTFPPWGGSDTTVDWEVEIVPPAPEAAAKKK
jgi:hypothetical protein